MAALTTKAEEGAPAAPIINPFEVMDTEEVKNIHQHAKEVISSLPSKVAFLRQITHIHALYDRHTRSSSSDEYLNVVPPPQIYTET